MKLVQLQIWHYTIYQNYMEQKMDLGIKIRKIRLQNKLTQQDIADQCGFTKGLLSKIENGSVVPPIATLTKLSKALGVKMSTLIDDADEGINAHFTDSRDVIAQ